jgi:hypothetical protein
MPFSGPTTLPQAGAIRNGGRPSAPFSTPVFRDPSTEVLSFRKKRKTAVVVGGVEIGEKLRKLVAVRDLAQQAWGEPLTETARFPLFHVFPA